jgi:hypothetical protein
MVQDVAALLSDAELYAKASACSKRYLASHHDKNVLVPEFRRVLLDQWHTHTLSQVPKSR